MTNTLSIMLKVDHVGHISKADLHVLRIRTSLQAQERTRAEAPV